MTEHKHSLVVDDADETGQRDSGQEKAAGVFRVTKEVEEHDAAMEGRKIRRRTEEDVRRMRRWAVGFVMSFAVVIFVAMHAQMSYYWRLLNSSKDKLAADGASVAFAEAMANVVAELAKIAEIMATPMTALITGAYISITAICVALLYGLFKSTSDIPPSVFANIIQRIMGNGQ